MLVVKIVLFVVVAVLIISHLQDNRIRLYFPTPKVNNSMIPDQTGKVVIVTGATAGLGKRTVYHLAKNGATVILTARTKKQAESTVAALQKENLKGKLIGMELELGDHKSIYKFANEFKKMGLPLHTLILNAGVMALPEMKTTQDGLEMQTGVNFIGHYYLEKLLRSKLEESAPSRVVGVTSNGHQVPSVPFMSIPSEFSSIRDSPELRKNYLDWKSYGYSKLYNIYHMREADEEAKKNGKQITYIAVHPGAVFTELGRYLGLSSMLMVLYEWTALPVEDGSVSQLWAATTKDVSQLGGAYVIPQARVVESSELAKDVGMRKKIMKEADEIISKWEK